MNRNSVTQPIHALDDFVCTAIHAKPVPQTKPINRGRNQDMSVVQEIVLDATNSAIPAIGLTASVQAMIRQLAEFVTNSSDPVATSATVQQRLIVEIKGLHKTSGA